MSKSCRSGQELSNEDLLAKIGVDTAENEPSENYQIMKFGCRPTQRKGLVLPMQSRFGYSLDMSCNPSLDPKCLSCEY